MGTNGETGQLKKIQSVSEGQHEVPPYFFLTKLSSYFTHMYVTLRKRIQSQPLFHGDFKVGKLTKVASLM